MFDDCQTGWHPKLTKTYTEIFSNLADYIQKETTLSKSACFDQNLKSALINLDA